MPKATDYNPVKEFTGLFIGRSGSGKSVAEASFPKPLYEFDIDGRFDGIYNAIQNGLIENGEEINYDRYPLNRSGFTKFNAKIEDLKKYSLSGQLPPAKTCALDSLTSLARLGVVLSQVEQGGKTLGNFRISGPADYNFESNFVLQSLVDLVSIKWNFIASAHILDKWGKPELELDNKGNPLNAFVPAEVIGEKLAIRDNLGENVLLYFSNVFRFDRNQAGNKLVYTVEFATDIAKNAFNLPPGKFNITDKPFYPFFLEAIEAAKEKKIKLVSGYNTF